MKNDDEDEKLACSNVGKPPIRVRHEKLKRVGDSAFRSECPACHRGVLMVRRDQETYELLKEDYCLLCGQAFVYESVPGGR